MVVVCWGGEQDTPDDEQTTMTLEADDTRQVEQLSRRGKIT
jgi:hypothetical protein